MTPFQGPVKQLPKAEFLLDEIYIIFMQEKMPQQERPLQLEQLW